MTRDMSTLWKNVTPLAMHVAKCAPESAHSAGGNIIQCKSVMIQPACVSSQIVTVSVDQFSGSIRTKKLQAIHSALLVLDRQPSE